MTLRARVATTAAVAVVLAVALVGALLYAATSRQVRRDLDAELLRAARLVAEADPAVRGALGGPRPGDGPRRRLTELATDGAVARLLGPLGGGVVQVVGPDGEVRSSSGTTLPVDAATAAIARGAGDGQPLYTDEVLDDRALRVVAVALPADEGAVQVAALADRAAPVLGALRRQLLVAGGLAAALAAVLGAVVASGAMRPVRRLTETAEAVGLTGDLTTRIEVAGDDELGRLAASFNGMLEGLERARAAQQQLVADASHELRTPLTSLRTNVEVLQLDEQLDDAERAALLRDVTQQLEEFGRLVDGLVELARGDRPARAPTRVALGALVADVVERAVVFHPDVPVSLTADRSVVLAERDRLERAVANLVDNAAKHGGGTPVEVVVADGEVRVRDHGAGIDAADQPHVFDRFYRAPGARSRPGSGLGLSIVAQVAAAHGGSVDATTHPDGGAVLTLRLPVEGPTGRA